MLHVSDCISPSSGATFVSCTSHLVYADTSGCCVAIATLDLTQSLVVCIPPFIDYLLRVLKFSGFFILIYFRSSCSFFLVYDGLQCYLLVGLFVLILT